MQSSLKSAKDTALEKSPAPNKVIQFLRSTAKSYASEKLGRGWTQIQETDQSLTDLAQDAQKIYDDTSSQLVDLFKSGFSTTSLVKAKTLLDEKAQQISELSQKAGKELYEKGQEEYLKNAPEGLKKFFNDDEMMKSILGSGAGTVAVWNKIKEVGEKGKWDDKGVQEVKDFVQQKIEEAKGGPQFDAAWSAAQGWLKSVPGGEKALETAKDIESHPFPKLLELLLSPLRYRVKQKPHLLGGEPMYHNDTYAYSTTASSTINAQTQDTATQYSNEDVLMQGDED